MFICTEEQRCSIERIGNISLQVLLQNGVKHQVESCECTLIEGTGWWVGEENTSVISKYIEQTAGKDQCMGSQSENPCALALEVDTNHSEGTHSKLERKWLLPIWGWMVFACFPFTGYK